MDNGTTVLGLDVHKETIVAAVLPTGRERVTDRMSIVNQPKALARLVKQVVTAHGPVRAVYEAGPCGYDVQRQLEALDVACTVIAPALTPVRPGDRVKTDRRDAEKLARLFRAGELTAIRIPSREEEATRDLVRVREDVLANRLRARHRVAKFLLRQGRVYRESRPWGVAHQAWLSAQRFAWPSLQHTAEAYLRTLAETDAHLGMLTQEVHDLAQLPAYRSVVTCWRCLKGIDTLSAVTLAVEVPEIRRFRSARAFMSYTGLVSREDSSGDRVRRGHITKAGNAHVRRVLVEAAWSYRHGNGVGKPLAERRKAARPEVVRLAQRAQDRLHRKFWRLVSRNKPSQVAVVAVARELAGFVWALAHQAQSEATA